MKEAGALLEFLCVAVAFAEVLGVSSARASDYASHPWDGAARSAWVEEAAKRTFKLEGPPDMAALSEVCAGACPESAYVRPEPSSPQQEVHAIGVYEGPEPRPDTRGRRPSEHPDPIDVRIRPTQKPVILVLTSPEPVTWRVHLDEGARLEGVRHNGLGRVELPAGGPLVQTVDRLPAIYSLFSGGDEFEVVDPQKTLRSLERSIGQAVDSFQGSYRGSAFVVPFCHDAAVLREVAAKVRELQAGKQATAPAPFDLVIGNALVRFNPPEDPGGRRTLVTFDRRDVRGAIEVDGKYYGITEFTLFVHDPKTGTTTDLEPPVGFPDPSRWEGIAYDATMKRLAIIPKSQYWYTYDPAIPEWRLFPWDYKKRPPVIDGAMVFDRNEGVFYGLAHFWPPQTQSGMVVVVLDSLFHPQRTITLSNPEAIPLGIDTELQLAKAGSSLVVYVQPGFTGEGRKTCLLVALPSGEITKLQLCSPPG